MSHDALTALRDDPIDWRYKGFPDRPGVTVGTVGDQHWSLLAGDLPTPALVLKEAALAHNLELMRLYCDARGVSLAPHGKTTMSPQLIARQFQAGAWGITAANVAQVRVFRHFGFERIVLANECVEPRSVRWLADELERDPGFDFYCLVDSVAAVRAMEAALAGGVARRIQVLVELGFEGGRTGARTLQDAHEVARAATASPVLEVAGVEGYEGILHGDDLADVLGEVDRFLDGIRELLLGLRLEREEAVVTAGGSAFFDHVCERLGDLPARLVLRSGCYVTHDSEFYEHLSPLGGRSAGGPRLRPALQAFGAVLSRPEPELALLLLGKRDVSFDISLPVPECVVSRGELRDATGMRIVELNDQHAYVRLPAGDPLAVGDLVGCGISHPCTTFDRWRLIPVVDDSFEVVDAVHTFF
ncbi:MAG: alanine racemase [Gaiellales bacterium]